MEATFNCDQCLKTFKTKFNLNKHTRSVHSVLKKKCEQCHTEFTRSDNLRAHEQTHKEEKVEINPKYFCMWCFTTFKSQFNLDRHEALVHDNYKPHMKVHNYQCDLCQKSFHKKNNLKIHKQQIHEEKRYKCHQCEYVTIWKDNLRRHKVFKHDTSNKTVKVVNEYNVEEQAKTIIASTCKKPSKLQKILEELEKPTYPRTRKTVERNIEECRLAYIEKKKNKLL